MHLGVVRCDDGSPLTLVSFLPYTIHFDIPARPPRPPLLAGQPSDERLAARFTRNPPSLDDALTPGSTVAPLLTNGSIEDDRDFFSRQSFATLCPTTLGSLPAPSPTLSEPHSAAWGTGSALTQPLSRAGPAPPVSILKHGRMLEDAARKDQAGFKKVPKPDGPFGHHYDAFGLADWTVQDSDRVNGGLRNAVRAVNKSDVPQERTWVGTLGMPTDALEDPHQRDEIENRLEDEFDCLTVWCKDSDLDGHYTHYCKQVSPINPSQLPSSSLNGRILGQILWP